MNQTGVASTGSQPAGAEEPIGHATETIVRASVRRSSSYIGLKRIDAPSDRSSC